MTVAQPQPPLYPPRRSGCGTGCLVGCLALLALLWLPVILAGGWGIWLWNTGLRHDPSFRLVAELVRQDGLVAQVLGNGSTVSGIDASNFGWMPGLAEHDYDVTLEGPKGEGHLAVKSHAGLTGPQLDSAILTGPDGRRYDLLKHQILPGDHPDTSI